QKQLERLRSAWRGGGRSRLHRWPLTCTRTRTRAELTVAGAPRTTSPASAGSAPQERPHLRVAEPEHVVAALTPPREHAAALGLHELAKPRGGTRVSRGARTAPSPPRRRRRCATRACPTGTSCAGSAFAVEPLLPARTRARHGSGTTLRPAARRAREPPRPASRPAATRGRPARTRGSRPS